MLGGQVRGWYSLDERTPSPHRGEDERDMAASELGAEGSYEEAVESMEGDVGTAGAGPSDAAQTGQDGGRPATSREEA